MAFLNPAALFFAALVPVIVALYLLKVRRRQETVSTLLFWKKVSVENRRRALWQKLRRPLSLLLQLLLLALVLSALARPEWSIFRGPAAAATVVMLDARARMQALTAGGPSRFEAARTAAAGWVRRAASGRPLALVTLTETARVAAPLSTDSAGALAALESLAPGDAQGAVESAFELSRALLDSTGAERRLIWISDEPPPTSKGPALAVEWVRLGEDADNVGLTRFALRTRPDSPDSAEVFVALANQGRAAANGFIEVALDGRLLESVPVSLEAGMSRGQAVGLPSLAGQPLNAAGLLTARWRPSGGRADALAADDWACAIAPRPRQLRVLLVTAGNAFLERCLAADENLRIEQLTPASYQARLASAFDVVILDQLAAGSDVLAELPAGRFLYLGHSPLGPNGAALERPVVSEADAADPLLRNADLREVNFLRAVRLPFAGSPERRGPWRLQAPLRAVEAPLVVAGERESGQPQRFLATAFGVADSDLPLRVAFPIFLGNALRWLAGETGEAATALRAGTVIALAEGESISAVPAQEAAAARSATRLRGPATLPLTRNGFYLRSDAQGQESWLAVCSLDGGRSNLRPSVPAGVAPPPPLAVPARLAWPPWMLLATAALALSLMEWFLYHRRRTE